MIRILFIISTLLLLNTDYLNAKDQEPVKLIIIHLDGVSSDELFGQMRKGNLPNLEAYFSQGGMIENTLTYYPTKTPHVISSIRSATKVRDTELVGWLSTNQIDSVETTPNQAFLQMAASASRIAQTNLVYGAPLLDRLAAPALGNLIDMIPIYNVMEFYWYATDTYGHLWGAEALIRKLQQFDRHFGRFARQLDDRINIVIYADHGMSYDKGVNVADDITAITGELLNSFSYPNLYLTNRDSIDLIARRVLAETDVDFTFYRMDEQTVRGFYGNSVLEFREERGRVRYTVEGHDPFSYYEKGYEGAYLNEDQWISFTNTFEYPLTPFIISEYLRNPLSGDIVTALRSGTYYQTLYSRRGNHGSFGRNELVVPLLIRGPLFEHLYDKTYLQLENLFDEVPDIEFDQKPKRDTHFLLSRYNPDNKTSVSRFAFSPEYRWRFGMEISHNNFESVHYTQMWGAYDVFRSYLARLWLSAGVDFRDERALPVLGVQHEYRIRRLELYTNLTTAGKHSFTISFTVSDFLKLQFTNFNSGGIRIDL